MKTTMNPSYTQNMLIKRLFVVLIAMATASSGFAYRYMGVNENSNGDGVNGQGETRAAACAPATALRDLETNNVRALIETGGSMWQDRSQSRAAYEVPKGGDVSSIYAGALWIGGLSPDQQLKLAAVTFRADGNDFWTGPLTTDGTAEINEAVCSEWDTFYRSFKQDAVNHRNYHDCINDPDCDLEESGLLNYVTPQYFFDWPGNGNPALGQDLFLAPFYDYDGNTLYEPNNGDYPWYDFNSEIDCFARRREDPVPLFGDENYFWIFNDKGNVHSESQGQPIGMEIRAQAFAFATNDEINNMTFYNYVLINQGTQTLTNTYFGQWVDADVGNSTNDYVGCDVQRGLGYAYNGEATDPPVQSSPGYGNFPPAVGVDFFEGPYQDADGIDNPRTDIFQDAIDSLGIPYRGIGIGYGDGVPDNERFGMRRFVYYNIGSNPINGDPDIPQDFYNYLNGIWKNGQKMLYGGDGVATGVTDIEADYMFPGDTDPFNWGTGGENVDPWDEVTAGNPDGDRRFIQAAGPFVLQPGDFNNVTVGVVWAQATSGGPNASVELMREADDKAQALFDNCFELISGPATPVVTIREMDQELILYLTNDLRSSNNFNEEYQELDPTIPEFVEGFPLDTAARSYFFQGYQIYQVADETVTPVDLNDVTKSRLLFTVDIQDTIDVIVNYTLDDVSELNIPMVMADGENEGVRHSFQITEDAFAQGDTRLINHKTYYFIVMAYGYNNFRDYNPITATGQPIQYLSSRTTANLSTITPIPGIPHKVDPENGGTIANSQYGDGVEITKWEGKGNGTNILDITPESEAEILAETIADKVTYVAGRGPVDIRIVDPLSVPFADFELRLAADSADQNVTRSKWTLTNLTMLQDNDASNDDQAVVESRETIEVFNDELLLDWGLSIAWQQYEYGLNGDFTDLLDASIEFENPNEPWLTGVADEEGFSELNWIRSGSSFTENDDIEEEVIFNDLKPGAPLDEDEIYENILGGTWAPYCLTAYTGEITVSTTGEDLITPGVAPTIDGLEGDLSQFANISGTKNVDIVITDDKSKWTRCGVIEMQAIDDFMQDAYEDATSPDKMRLRRHASVDKNGRTVDEGGNAAEATLNGAQPYGMGWFPGYAIDVGTGERLNMAFGEDSWFAADNGNDMLWNPSERITSNLGSTVYAGGQHWIYVFKNERFERNSDSRMPAYDQGQFMYQNMEEDFNTGNRRAVMRSCIWVGSSLLAEGYEMKSVEDGLIPNDVRVRLRIAKEYEEYSPIQGDTEETSQAENFWHPYYTFSTKSAATITDDSATLESALDIINVVPNPYYSHSAYEVNKLDNRVKITNLPEVCTISIYNLNGTLIRQYVKADPLTSLDWDLKNQANVPIAGGVYIIHIDVPDVGEKILKWFGVIRPTDLDNF